MFGASVRIVGQVQRKNPYTNKNTGVTRFMLNVAVIGGMYSLDLGNKEALDAAPEVGKTVQVDGNLVHNSFGGFDVVVQKVTVVAEDAAPKRA
jgi:hypothetical protein